MARGKYLSLEEARKMKHGLKRFAREHPSTGDEDAFDAALEEMAKGKLTRTPTKKPKRNSKKQKAKPPDAG